MKLFVLLLLSLLPLAPLQAAPESHPYVVYAEFQQETTVELSDGTQWVMDAGDCFPIYMFKENQTKVVLQLGSNTFRAETGRVKVLKDGEAQRGLASYRKTLENYLKSKSDAWKRGREVTPGAAPGRAAIPFAMNLKLYVKTWCPWCVMAQQYLDQRGYQYELIDVESKRQLYDEMIALSGQRRTPTLKAGDLVLPDFGPEELEAFLGRHALRP